ncbi:MAG: 1-deoxy-D-xylulose-5-phosphate synthase [Gammaproteobacteria bacterium]
MAAETPLLDSIQSTADIRGLGESQLEQLAHELRDHLIDCVAETGGHFAAGLGTVELTVALHHVFQTPDDRLIWDVGHQCYPHKILTGRRERMSTIRQYGGLSGFPRREESEYDTFGVGHAGTSIGGAVGMAEASKLQGIDRQVVAIIGDGAMTCGMAFEALNHAGHIESDVLVILNDNNMSISPNVGAMSSYLTRILSGRLYSTMREGGKRVLSHLPPMKELARRAEEHMKGMVSPGTLFEEMGFTYYGPIDGHDVSTLVRTMENLKALRGPRLLHIITKKGKGYEPAEADPIAYHGVTPFNRAKGISKAASGSSSPSYTQVFGQWLCDMAEQDPKLVGITPAMREGSGLVEFSRRYPDRYFDVGIAEQHAVTLAAGMACDGAKPVVAIYSTFLQRAYDQVVHDVCIQNLPVLFAIDRAGIVGPDGATHAGTFDIGFLRALPNMVVMTPADENECRAMLTTGHELNQPAAVRYPRGKGPGKEISESLIGLEIGKGVIERQGENIAILAFGVVLKDCLTVGDELNATVANMRFVKPLDEALILELAKTHDLLVTVEDHATQSGAGSAVGEVLAAQGAKSQLMILGLPDAFLEHGSREEILADAGLDAMGIRSAIDARWSRMSNDSGNAVSTASQSVG